MTNHLHLSETGFTTRSEYGFRRLLSPARSDGKVQALEVRLDISEKEHACASKADMSSVGTAASK